MTSARVFRTGNSQAVRLPKKLKGKSSEVQLFRSGNENDLHDTVVRVVIGMG